MSIVLTLVVVAATVLGSWMAAPQALRLARTRRVEGVSAVWIGVSLALNGWWLSYGLASGRWALVPVSTISLLLYASMAVVYLSTVGRRAVAPLAAGVFVLGMVPLPFLLVGGWSLAAVAVGLSYGIQLLPAVVASCRTRELSGVSAPTWLIAFVESGLWLVYGLAVGDIALIVAGGVGVLLAGVILARLWITGHEPFVAVDPRRLAIARSA
jgi:MtN3 and saliva related transmembrane protein